MTRHVFFLALALAGTSPAAPSPAARAARPAAATSTLHHFTSGPAGFHTRSTWIDTGSEVVAFGAQFTPELAEELLADIQSRTSSPLRWVVVLHPNPDKFNGVGPLRAAGAEVVASAATAAAIPGVHAYKRHYFVHVAGMFTEETYPPEPAIDQTFDDRLELPLAGDARITLRVLENPGVAATQTIAHVQPGNHLLVGDLVHHRAHAWLEGGIVDGAPAPDLAAWAAALDELAAYPGATVHGGRGQPGPLEQVVPAQQAYLEDLEDLARAYLLQLEDPAVVTGPDAAQHHRALAQRAAALYPEHEHAYLVEFGIYGLLGRLLEDMRAR